MDEDDKVISLAQHRARKNREQTAVPAKKTEHAAGEGAQGGNSQEPVPGKLIWLRCPSCGTLEYTELEMPGGRSHKCGTVVEEAVVDVDIRAELTITAENLKRIDTIALYLRDQRERFMDYRQRLGLMGGGELKIYSLEDESVSKLPVAGVDAMGLLISTALHNPSARFSETPSGDGEEG